MVYQTLIDFLMCFSAERTHPHMRRLYNMGAQRRRPIYLEASSGGVKQLDGMAIWVLG